MYSGGMMDRGSILFDKYIQEQNQRMQRDQEEFEKQNDMFKKFLQTNNAGGQELFDEIDKNHSNLKKMIKVKVKPDPVAPKSKPKATIAASTIRTPQDGIDDVDRLS